MNRIAIVFVPAGASQQDFEDALREHCAALEIINDPTLIKPGRTSVTDNDQLPLWSWFFPRPQRG